MEKIKEISRKYILEDDTERLLEILKKVKIVFSNNKEDVNVYESHLIEIATDKDGPYIEFDNTEIVRTEESNIIPYLEYVLNIYKSSSENPNCIISPVIKIEPSYNYMQIVVDDIKITIKDKNIDNIFMSLKNSGLIDSYSVYSSQEKYQKIKKCDYCLSGDQFGFLLYTQVEVPEFEKTNNSQKVLKPNNIKKL